MNITPTSLLAALALVLAGCASSSQSTHGPAGGASLEPAEGGSSGQGESSPEQLGQDQGQPEPAGQGEPGQGQSSRRPDYRQLLSEPGIF